MSNYDLLYAIHIGANSVRTGVGKFSHHPSER